MVASYSPVTMDELSYMATRSEKGALVASMSLMNPLTKYLMQVQNMVGKKVIGISAVGEKVFYNLSYYYNEGIRSNNERWINNLLSCHEFSRIQNRFAYEEKTGELEQAIKTSIANINFDDVEGIRLRFLFVNNVDKELREKYEITDDDVNNKTEKWEIYQKDLKQKIEELSKKHKNDNWVNTVDLIISQILSAATDNAKELILDKINCGENLAKCHLFLIMQGFNIKDVVSFMTSPCVSLINNLTEANMMDPYINSIRIEDSINLCSGLIDPSKFLFGTVISRNDESYNINTRPLVEFIFDKLTGSKLNSILIESAKTKNASFKGFENLSEFIQEYIKLRVNGEDLKSLDSYIGYLEYEHRKAVSRMSDYIERIIYQISKARQKYADRNITEDMIKAGDDDGILKMYIDSEDDFNADLEEFKKINELANEISTFGGTYLGLNQGLPGTKEELQERNRKIKASIKKRENIFKIGYNTFKIQEDIHNDEQKEKYYAKMSEKMNELYKYNQLLDQNVILQDMMTAHAFDIIGNFDIESWLYDKQLTRNDIVHKEFIGEEIDIDLIFNGKETFSYRDLVGIYYNCIKGSINIFDAVNKIPQYKALIDLYKTIYVFDKYTSSKSQLNNIIYDKVYNVTKFVDENQNKVIANYINELLINSFFREFSFKFPRIEGSEYLDNVYNIKQSKRQGSQTDLGTSFGRASFKMEFENMITILKQEGKYGNDITIPNYKQNRFLQDLGIVYDQNEIPRLTLELDMMKINSTPNSQKVFQEYLNGLNNLENIKINGISLPNWFILYNLFVYQNQYGSDRLTTVFKHYVKDNNSVLNNYFQYIGDIDFNKITEDVLKDLEFNMRDILIRIAPVIPRFEENRSKLHFIKVKNKEGELVIKEKTPSGRYLELSTFPSGNKYAKDDGNITDEQKYNYRAYQMIPMKNQDFDLALREGLMSLDPEILANSLRNYAQRGLLIIEKINC